MDRIREFALEIVQSVRDHTDAHESDIIQLSVWIANYPQRARLVDALINVLQYDKPRIISVVEDAVQAIPDFRNFPLAQRIRCMIRNRG